MRALAGLVDEMDRDAFDGGLVMREAVDLPLLPPPIEILLPVIDQFLERLKIGAICPLFIAEVARPARLFEPRAQVGEYGSRDSYLERFLFGHRSTPLPEWVCFQPGSHGCRSVRLNCARPLFGWHQPVGQLETE